MDIPNGERGDNSNVPRIRNLHPSQLTPTDHYGAIHHEEEHIPIERTASTFSERLGSFVGSYSRTSMMFMAENLAVPNGPLVSIESFLFLLNIYTKNYPTSSTTKKKINIQPFHLVLFQGFHQKLLCHV